MGIEEWEIDLEGDLKLVAEDPEPCFIGDKELLKVSKSRVT